LDLDDQCVTWLCILDFEWPCEVVDLGQVNVFNVVCVVGILNLTTGPVDAFNLDNLPILDLVNGRDYVASAENIWKTRERYTIGMPAILDICQRLKNKEVIRAHM
jgi:hypothetical protein